MQSKADRREQLEQLTGTVVDDRGEFLAAGGRTVGGMLEMTREWEGIPSTWMVYFATRDTDETAKRATELGGSVGAPPFDTAFGRIAVLVDPAGGHFSVVTSVAAAAG